MKVIAVNSSDRPRRQTKTGLMLKHLIKGMEEAGAEVTRVDLREKEVKHCIGCFSCWTKTPGRCVIKDDMTREIFPAFVAADLAVLATPLFHYTVNATMKAFIERTLPVLEPFMERHGDRTHHPLRTNHPAVALLSVAGFPEPVVFEQLSSWARFVYGEGLVAEIYRPAAESMPQSPLLPDILRATEDAGRELATTLRISPETMSRITVSVGSTDSIAETANLFWKGCITEGITPAEAAARGLIPRPDTIANFLRIMRMGFNPARAEGVNATIQFNFTGSPSGTCHLTIADDRLVTSAEAAEAPALTVTTDFETWMDILTGKLDGAQAFMDGRYTAEGDLELLTRMGSLFAR